jgi:uncharacterized protein (DUF302 family)
MRLTRRNLWAAFDFSAKDRRMVKQSRLTFTETVVALSAAITEAGNTIFASIDQAAAAKSAGLSLRPTTLLVFGNPKGGTPLMDAHPLAALDLPLKVLVWEDGASVKVAYTPATEIARRYGIPADEPHVAAMERTLDALTASLS